MNRSIRNAFIEAAIVPLDGTSHASGSLDVARSLLAANPELAVLDIYTAAILGEADAVSRFLQENPGLATAPGAPLSWDALTHLCFSRFLRLDPSRSAGFVEAARLLLGAGASANTGWRDTVHYPEPGWEPVLYGAAGVARHPGVTRVLLEHGADPDDLETTYHIPEGYDNEVMHVLVEVGKPHAGSLATMLLRKADWHDESGVRYLLTNGADPKHMTQWHFTALHQAIRRDNGIGIIDAMLDHGADPTLPGGEHGANAVAMAARRGRGDVLKACQARGYDAALTGADALIAACALSEYARIEALAHGEALAGLRTHGGWLLGAFAGNGNTEGVLRLLDLGVPIDAPYPGDAYFDIPAGSTALHVAAWRARHETVAVLLERGARVDARDGRGATPLMRAIKACVDSYWMSQRTPASVEALLRAGASTKGVRYPCGYEAVDTLLVQYR
jgi:Ankyrin repeats (many copies)/Ankyrin repeat